MSNWFKRAIDDSEYNVEDDFEEMNKPRKCRKCGCTFTLDEAFSDFLHRFNCDLSYNGCGYDGKICGNCAADIEESKFI